MKSWDFKECNYSKEEEYHVVVQLGKHAMMKMLSEVEKHKMALQDYFHSGYKTPAMQNALNTLEELHREVFTKYGFLGEQMAKYVDKEKGGAQ